MRAVLPERSESAQQLRRDLVTVGAAHLGHVELRHLPPGRAPGVPCASTCSVIGSSRIAIARTWSGWVRAKSA